MRTFVVRRRWPWITISYGLVVGCAQILEVDKDFVVAEDGGAGAGSGGGGAGASSGGGSSCTADAGCAVSFETQVFPILEIKAKCTDWQCHGPGAAMPMLTADDPKKLREELLGTTLWDYPYINCDDPADSKLLCNLRVEMEVLKPPHCGALMPKVDPDDTIADSRLNQTDYFTIEDWIKCGAPDN